MGVGLRYRLGGWKRIPADDVPEPVEREMDALVETYKQVHGKPPDRESFMVEWDDYRYKVKLYDRSDSQFYASLGDEVIYDNTDTQFYASPNTPRWRRGLRWARRAPRAAPSTIAGLARAVSDARIRLFGKERRLVLSVFVWVVAGLLAAYVTGGALGYVASSGGGAGGVGALLPLADEPGDNIEVRGSIDSHDGYPASQPEAAGVFTFDTGAVERGVLKLTDEVRAEHGLDGLDYSERLSEPAHVHADDMAEHDYVNHTAKSGETSAARYVDACDGVSTGENLASTLHGQEFEWEGEDVYLADEEDIAEFLVDAWMESEGHREVLLSDWDEIGVAVEIDDGKVFAVQAFCGSGE